jgi:hypothetical protein
MKKERKIVIEAAPTKLQTAMAHGKPSEVSLAIKALRCRCGNPWNIHACRCDDRESHKGKPCPSGNEPCPYAEVEEHGTVSYWNRNPFKRFVYWFKKTILGRKVTT